MGFVPCMSLSYGHTNALDGLKTPNETIAIFVGVYSPVQPGIHMQLGCYGGEDMGEAEKERADRERQRRNQVSYPGRDDRPQRRQKGQTRRGTEAFSKGDSRACASDALVQTLRSSLLDVCYK